MPYHGSKGLILFIATTFTITACSVIGAPSNAEAINQRLFTQAAETVIAQLTPSPGTLTAMATQPPSTATPFVGVYITRSPTPPPTPTQTLEPVVSPVLVHANVLTNCRAGPSSAFEIVGTLLAGESVSLRGKSDPEGWWYIANPMQRRKVQVDTCWVYAGSVTLTGDPSGAPFVSPPPTATAAP